MKIHLPIRRKLFLSHFLALLLVCGTVGTYIYLSAVENLKTSLQSRLRNSAALLSEILDASRLDEIQGEAAQTLPVYQEDLELLRTFRRSNPDIAYLYVMRRVADRMYFVLDSDETEKQALPGREYVESVPAMLEGFSHPSVDDDIMTDEWGATLSGYAPLKDGEGQYLIGIDMDATHVESKFQKLHVSAIMALLFGFLLAVVLSRFLASQLTTPITLVISRCQAIAEGRLDEQVEIRHGDEVGALISAVNNMSVKLSESQEHRREAEEALKRANEDLEARIRERTRDLRKLNATLQNEIDMRNETMDALRASEERHRKLADLLPQPVFETDSHGRLSFMNRAAFETFEYRFADFDRGLNLQDVFAAEERSRIPWEPNLRTNGDRAEGVELTARRKDGSTFPTLVYVSAIMAGEGPAGLRGIIIDMTEHKFMEGELLKAQKLESIGILAGGIAHDFNNLLTAILGNISLAHHLVESEPKLSKLMGDAEKASLQARNLTRQLVSLAKGGVPAKSTFSLRESVTDAADLALSGSNAKCRLQLAEDLWPVYGDPGQIHQLVSNLVLNAKEFMPEGGTVEIDVSNFEAAPLEMPSLNAGKYVRITVNDYGMGISAENLPRVFDPYFSTKERGTQKGMGLGLTIVHAIVRRHEGHISIRSTPGTGTEVQVFLPASQDKLPETPRPAKVKLPSLKGRVLYMDDDDMVRELVREMLIHSGFEVEVARDGLAAVQLFREARENRHPFDLVVLDLTVRGGMGGKEAVKALQQIDASVKALVASGYADDSVITAYAEYGFVGAITKPYQMEKLSEILQAAIRESRP